MELPSGHIQDTATSLDRSETGEPPLIPPHSADARHSNSTNARAKRSQRAQIQLDSALLRQLRRSSLMSQQDLADDCWRRNIRLSLTTIKRAELGRPVLYRVAREYARCFEVPVTRLLRSDDASVMPP
jgi:DNA-binding XRE family transcriptional regulator